MAIFRGRSGPVAYKSRSAAPLLAILHRRSNLVGALNFVRRVQRKLTLMAEQIPAGPPVVLKGLRPGPRTLGGGYLERCYRKNSDPCIGSICRRDRWVRPSGIIQRRRPVDVAVGLDPRPTIPGEWF